MSASCLELLHRSSAELSAPPALDSDCMEPLDEGHSHSHSHSTTTTTRDTDGPQGDSLLRTSSGGLGMALEEELAMLTGQREDEGELSASNAPVMGQNTDLLALFRQKEKDLVLAAKLGKALLERNQDLTQQYEKMNKDLNEKLEHLEQEKHALRRRLERREGEWEGRVAELETDLQQLQGELERHQAQLREADRDKSRAVGQLSEQNHRLLEQLSRAAEVERQLSTQVHSLREEFREKSLSSSQHMTRLETEQAEIKMLSENKRELESRVRAALEENELLQHSVAELRERTLVLERRCQEKDIQLRQSHLELQEVRVSHRQLSSRLEELAEERSLQDLGVRSSSLLSEIEQSMEQEEQEQEREQLRLQLWEAYCQVRSLCSHLRGSDLTDSALSTDSSMDESSDSSSAKELPTGSLHASLLELRRLTQNLLDCNDSTGSRRSEEEALEEQVRRLAEELRDVRRMYDTEQDRTRHSQDQLVLLHNQMALLSVEMSSVREESERVRAQAQVTEPSEQLHHAIRDRDDAIAKKKAVEMELARSKVDIMSLNSQLLDAIQQKLNLSQQLEAWQDDMHRVIDRQLMDQQQEEWMSGGGSSSSSSFSSSSAHSSRRKAHRHAQDKTLFSFFKKN